MIRYNSRILRSVATVAAAAALALGATAASAAPRAASGHTATEHFQITSTELSASKSTLITYGKGTAAAGTDISHPHNTDTFKFADGSYFVRHTQHTVKNAFSPRTCLLQVIVTGKYQLSRGTGAYRGISGHGTYRLSILNIFATAKGKCTSRKTPLSSQVFVAGSGPVTLP